MWSALLTTYNSTHLIHGHNIYQNVTLEDVLSCHSIHSFNSLIKPALHLWHKHCNFSAIRLNPE